VLVDEAGAVQEGIPATRKIALPHPSAAAMPIHSKCAPLPDALECFVESPRELLSGLASRRIAPPDPTTALPRIGSKIDWDISPNQLLAGDLSALDPQDARLIERAAALPEAIALAKQMNIDPIVLIVALIARSQSLRNRSAARIAKAIFGDGFTEELRSIAEKLDLV
jgi:hypothetical protein